MLEPPISVHTALCKLFTDEDAHKVHGGLVAEVLQSFNQWRIEMWRIERRSLTWLMMPMTFF